MKTTMKKLPLIIGISTVLCAIALLLRIGELIKVILANNPEKIIDNSFWVILLTALTINNVKLGKKIKIITTVKKKLEYPVSLMEAKRHLRVVDEFTDNDDFIKDIIEDATEIIEHKIQKDIAKTSNVISVTGFALSISYTTGYEIDNIPKTLKRAILIKIGDLYDIERHSWSPKGIKNNGVLDRMLQQK